MLTSRRFNVNTWNKKACRVPGKLDVISREAVVCDA